MIKSETYYVVEHGGMYLTDVEYTTTIFGREIHKYSMARDARMAQRFKESDEVISVVDILENTYGNTMIPGIRKVTVRVDEEAE